MEAGQLLSQRFELRRRIGEGGTGEVYEAHDRETDSVVALKTLRMLDGHGLYLFKKEFRALADLEHPNLIRLGELLCENDQWFFTMELVSGEDFLSYVHGVRTVSSPATEMLSRIRPSIRPVPRVEPPVSPRAAPGFRFDDHRLRDALGQLATAIDAVHRSGRIHRDIKPSNALVCHDGRVVLLDFGLIDDLHPAENDEGSLMGTPAYMAPEQVLGGPLGPATDWYAFGTMLFCALTGVLPFEGSADSMMEVKCTQPAPAPRELLPSLPADLAALCHELLQQEPEGRPTGEEVLRRLGVSVPEGAGEVRDAEVGDGPPFTGRDAELAALAMALHACRAGGAVSVLVSGEPGMGKSALVKHFLQQEARGAHPPTVLAGRCYEQESVPFRAFDAVIDDLSRQLMALDEEESKALLSGGVHFLAGVFPVLRRVPVIESQAPRASSIDNPLERRAAAFRELKQLLAALARRTTLVLSIDDLQWADEDSVALLTFLVAGADAPACLLVATMRADSPSALPGGALAAHGDALAVFRRIHVGGLSGMQAEDLFANLWRRYGQGEPGARARTLLEEAKGHPLFLAELARHAASADGNITRLRLEDVLAQRVQGLEPAARRLVEYAALAGVPTDYQVIGSAAGLDATEGLLMLGKLRAAQLIRLTRRGEQRLIEPYHDRIREAVRDRLAAAPEELRHSHLRLGRELLARTKDVDEVVFHVVRHFNEAAELITEAPERTRIAELNLAAARKAKVATAHETALRHVERGLALLDAAAWEQHYELKRDLERERVEALYLANRPEEGATQAKALVPRLRSPAEQAELYAAKVMLDTGCGRFKDAIAATNAGLMLFGEPLPRKPSTLSVLLEYAAIRFSQGRRSTDALSALPELCDPDKRQVMQLLMAAAPAAFFSDSILLSVVLMRIARMSLQHGLCDVSAYGFAGFGLVLSGAFFKHKEANEYGQLALRLNERFANTSITSKLYMLTGTYLTPWVRGFAAGQEETRLGFEAGAKYGDAAYECYAAATHGLLVSVESRALAQTFERLRACHEITSRHKHADMGGVIEAHWRFAAALMGESGALDELGRPGSSEADFLAQLSAERTPTAMFNVHWVRGELSYFHGDVRKARAELDAAAPLVHAAFGVPTLGEYALFRGLTAARLCDESAWLGRLRLRREIRGQLKKLGKWAAFCPANFAARHRLLQAELDRVSGRTERALSAYLEVAALARAHCDLKREALAYELRGRLSEALGRHQDASVHFALACDAYRRWGAQGKAKQLEDRSASPARREALTTGVKT